MWYCILHSGIHTTIAGVILAATIPFTIKETNISPLRFLEEKLHTFSGFIILPLFAFFNADIDLDSLSFKSLSNPVPLGIMLGLLIGKPVGITLITYLSVKIKLCSLPKELNYYDILGVSFLCGIGFTMSLFVGNLAFVNDIEYMDGVKIGVLVGSLLSTILGFILIYFSKNDRR